MTIREMKTGRNRLLLFLMAFILVMGSSIPVSFMNASEVNAASSFAGTETTTFSGDYGHNFRTTDGEMGVCVEPEASTGKARGEKATRLRLSNNTAFAKIAYYQGYLNPRKFDDGLDSNQGTMRMMQLAAISAGWAKGPIRWASWETTSWRNKYQEIYKKVVALPAPPDTFIVHRNHPTNGKIQDFVSWKMTKPSSLTLKKTSGIPAVSTEGNYNFTGIKYQVYKSDKKTKVGVLTCNANGTTNTITGLAPGTYYAQEIATNKYYALNTGWCSVTVAEGKTGTFNAKDVPYRAFAQIEKVSTDPKVLLSGYSFEGIQYTIYKSDKKSVVQTLTVSDSGSGTAKKGVTPKSKELPLGTYYVKETKTNKWFELSTKWYSFTLSDPGQIKTLRVSDYPTPTPISIKKKLVGDVKDEDRAKTFSFTLTNKVTGQRLGNTIVLKGDGTPVNLEAPAGTYILHEILDGADEERYTNETGDQTIVIGPGQSYEIEHVNRVRERNSLTVQKRTDDGGTREGFRFKVTGVLNNAGELTASKLLEIADPKVTVDGDQNAYDVSTWTVDTESLAALNDAAKNRQPGSFNIKISATAEANAEAKRQIEGDLEEAQLDLDRLTLAYNELVDNGITEGEEYEEVKALYETAQRTVEDLQAQLDALGTKDIEVSVPVELKDCFYDETEDKFDAKADNIEEKTSSGDGYSVSFKSFDWLGAATIYKDVETGEDFTMMVTNLSGIAIDVSTKMPQISDLSPGIYTVEEIMTEEQAARYRQPEKQTKEIASTGESLSFTFVNKAPSGSVVLKKTSADNKISGISFKLSGKTAYGEDFELERITDSNGEIDFGTVPKGEYVMEETGWESDKYSNPYKLEGYEVPAQKVTVTGEETEPITVTFENKPYGQVLITKVDEETQSFLPGATFDLKNKTKGQVEATFKIDKDEEGYPVVTMIRAESDIKAIDNTDLTDEESADTGEGAITTGDDSDTNNTDENSDQASSDTENTDASSDQTTPDAGAGDDSDLPQEDTQGAAQEETSTNNSADVEITYNYIKLTGLAHGDEYEIVETDAPTGYGLADAIVEFTADYDQTPKIIFEDNASKIRTTAVDSDTKDHHSLADSSITIIDNVKYENLIPGKEYTLTGTLMDVTKYKQTNNISDITEVTVNGKPVTVTETFTPQEKNGSHDITFKFDGTGFAGKSLVAYEKLYIAKTKIADHEDPEDPEQTVTIPEIGTYATADDTKDSVTKADEKVIITDVVSYRGLAPGKEYTMSGTLMDKSTHSPLMVNGKAVTQSKNFTPQSEAGTVFLTFEFDGTGLDGKSVVVFEELYIKGNPAKIAEHKDINDPAQTVNLPKIGTKASRTSENEIKDVVAYKNLVAGRTYTFKGVLMDKATGKSTGYTAEKTVKIGSNSGMETLIFKVDSKKLAGKTVVAFEKVYLHTELDGVTNPGKISLIEVGSHEDLNDPDQSVDMTKAPKAPKTGQSLPWILVLLGLIAAGSGTYAIRNRFKAVSK